MNERVLVEKIENGYVTVAETKRATRTVYHSSLKGVIAEFNKAFGSLRLTKDQTSGVINFLKKRLQDDAKGKGRDQRG